MKIEKNGNHYRVRKTINGHFYNITFDHKPTQKEVQGEIAKLKGKENGNLTFFEAVEETIRIKENVISPASIRKYNAMKKQFSAKFSRKHIDDITQADVQGEINRLAASRSPKTVRDYHGFISSVFALFRPSFQLHSKLPMRKAKEPAYIPNQSEIREIIEEVKDTEFEVPFILGCYSLRRAEVCALTIKDVDFESHTIRVNKALVLDQHGEWVVKGTKTTASTRTIYVPDEVLDAIKRNGMYKGHPNQLNKHLHMVQNKLGIHPFSFHKLRHFFVSQALASKDVSIADVQKYGGWATDSVMKTVYNHSTKSAEQVSNAIKIF